MIRITKLSDYGTVILAHLANDTTSSQISARDIAQRTNIPLPMVSKIMKVLVQKGLLVSHRGVNGGYSLARPPQDISLAEIICALEGPIRITDCVGTDPVLCDPNGTCPGHRIWPQINRHIQEALESITLATVADAGI